MNWPRTILDGIMLCLVFNLTIAILWMFIPNAFCNMLPAEIRKASPKRKKKEVIILASIIYPIYPLMFAYMIASSRMAGVSGFWNLFWTGYIEMFFVNLGDLIGLDYFFRKISMKKIMIPGTEHCKAWETKTWMKTLGFPEHLIVWPFVFCPLTGLIVAGFSRLIFGA